MKKLLLTLAVALSIFSDSASAYWFFYYVPGSTTSSIADFFTGAEGDHCIKPGMSVGDVLVSPDGKSAMRIESITGTSPRCASGEHPIRAKMTPTAPPTKEEIEKQQAAKSNPQPRSTSETAQQLRELKALKDEGAITNAEYEAKKKFILRNM